LFSKARRVHHLTLFAEAEDILDQPFFIGEMVLNDIKVPVR
jgi:hypothetical protein